MSKNKIIKISVIFLLLVLFMKTDFRLKTEIECCNDDHDYFMHSETIAIDFDFDYSNQLKGFETRRNFVNSKPSPIGFFGTGLLSAPFLFFGNLLDKLINLDDGLGYSNKVLFYSFSSVFYLFLTFFILSKIKDLLNIKYSNLKLLIIFLGTGLPYYAFERYSMTHVYDTFAITCLIYFLICFYKTGEAKYVYFISFFNFLTLLIRWTNYQIFLLPLIVKGLFFANSKSRLMQSVNFHLMNTLFFILFLIHSKLIWGIYTINPRDIYNQHDFVSTYFESLLLNPIYFISENINDFFIVVFTQEFGIFWFSPVIFYGVLFSILFIIKDKKISFLLITTFAFYFMIINAWQSTGNAYGFRYVYPLITISVLIYFYQIKYVIKYKNITSNYLLIFSLISIFSVLFFEGWTGTQLSLEIIENSFGKHEKFVQPYYLSGLFNGFLEINAYLKIFTTSILGMLIFKTLVGFFGIEGLNNFLDRYGLPVNNSDFQEYLTQVNQVSVVSVFLIILLCILLSKKILDYLEQS